MVSPARNSNSVFAVPPPKVETSRLPVMVFFCPFCILCTKGI